MGAAIILIMFFTAALAGLIAPYDPLAAQPEIRLAAPSWDHPFGTDDIGRDVLSRVTNDIDNIGQSLQQTLTQLITALLTLALAFALMITPANAGPIASGAGPPVAQSSISIVWTKGAEVPRCSCIMQPILPVAITSAPVARMFATLRARRRDAQRRWRASGP